MQRRHLVQTRFADEEMATIVRAKLGRGVKIK